MDQRVEVAPVSQNRPAWPPKTALDLLREIVDPAYGVVWVRIPLSDRMKALELSSTYALMRSWKVLI